MVNQAMAFAELAEHTKLDFEEFLAMQPRKLRDSRSADQIKAWFDAADVNHDGVLSLDEFFIWSLGTCAEEHGGASIRACFEKFDANGSGKLDAKEFSEACKMMGFGHAMAEAV